MNYDQRSDVERVVVAELMVVGILSHMEAVREGGEKGWVMAKCGLVGMWELKDLGSLEGRVCVGKQRGNERSLQESGLDEGDELEPVSQAN